MGYPNSNHIQEFVRGQTVRQLTTDKNGCAWLELASGEKLRMFPTIELGKPVIIATPFCADGQVKTSTQIMANSKPASHCEQIILECVPGGDICDPQTIADNIRAYFKSVDAQTNGGSNNEHHKLSVGRAENL